MMKIGVPSICIGLVAILRSAYPFYVTVRLRSRCADLPNMSPNSADTTGQMLMSITFAFLLTGGVGERYTTPDAVELCWLGILCGLVTAA